jgi:hypothetical protein
LGPRVEETHHASAKGEGEQEESLVDQVSISFKMNFIGVLRFIQPELNLRKAGEEGSGAMRLFLMGFGIVVGLAIIAENERPQCSMANMLGVEWVECLIQ